MPHSLEAAAHTNGNDGNLIPTNQRFIEWRDHAVATWQVVSKAHDLSGFYDLRAAYACERYQALTDQPAPVVAGHRSAARESDQVARQTVAQELGHGRTDVVAAYIGRSKQMAGPPNQDQAARRARLLLIRSLPGSRRGTVREHVEHAGPIGDAIWRRWRVGPYQWQAKHLRWFLTTQTTDYSPSTRYRYWLTIRALSAARQKQHGWLHHLQGPWVRPSGLQARSSTDGHRSCRGRSANLPPGWRGCVTRY